MSGDGKIISSTGRYQTTVNTTVKNGREIKNVETIKFYAKDGTQLKPDYYSAAEAKDLANQNGYDKYYKTEVVQKDGKYYVKVTVKEKQSAGILAEDYLKTVNDGTIKEANPGYFDGYNSIDDTGHQQSDLNKEMAPGESLLIPADKVSIDDSPTGWFKRNVMNIVY